MRSHSIDGGGSDLWRQWAVDARGHLTGGGAAGLESFDHLCLALGAVRDVLLDDARRFFDDRPMAGKQAPGRQIAHAPEGVKVLQQVAPLAGRNHDRSTEADKVAAIKVAGRFVKKNQVIRRMSRGGHDPQHAVAGRHVGGPGKSRSTEHSDAGPPLPTRLDTA